MSVRWLLLPLAATYCALVAEGCSSAESASSAGVPAPIPDVGTDAAPGGHGDADANADAGAQNGKVRFRVAAVANQSFGVGPSVKFWFSGRNTLGSKTIDAATDPEIGTSRPNRTPNAPWTYWYDERAQRYFTPTINNVGDTNNTFYSYIVDMGATASEAEGYLVSWRFVIPDNFYFPGTDAKFWDGSDKKVGSSMKMAWITRDGDDTGHGDLCPLTHIGGGNLGSLGNGTSVHSAPTSDSHYFASLTDISRTDHSNRALAYLQKASNLASGDKSHIEWSLVSSVAHKYTNADRAIDSNTLPMNQRFIAFPGWLDTTRDGRSTTASSQVLYGDIYVAQGASAQARLEIGDAATYESCKWLFLAPPVSWSDTSVESDFYPDEIQKSKYWYLTTANGTRYSGALSN